MQPEQLGAQVLALEVAVATTAAAGSPTNRCHSHRPASFHNTVLGYHILLQGIFTALVNQCAGA